MFWQNSKWPPYAKILLSYRVIWKQISNVELFFYPPFNSLFWCTYYMNIKMSWILLILMPGTFESPTLHAQAHFQNEGPGPVQQHPSSSFALPCKIQGTKQQRPPPKIQEKVAGSPPPQRNQRNYDEPQDPVTWTDCSWPHNFPAKQKQWQFWKTVASFCKTLTDLLPDRIRREDPLLHALLPSTQQTNKTKYEKFASWIQQWLSMLPHSSPPNPPSQC